MDFGLKGKTALVLGGSGGLVRAISKALIGEGANVAVADIDPDGIAGTESALSAIGATPARGQDSALWSKHFQAMVLSVIAITDRVLPNMWARHSGRMVTSTSSGVVAPIPQSGYFQCTASFAGWMVKDSGA